MDSETKTQKTPKKKKVPRCRCKLEDGKKCKKKLSSVDLCCMCG